jgi:hypothetical protein
VQVDVAGIFLKCEIGVSLLEAKVLRPCPCPSPSGRAPRPLCKCVPGTPWGTRVTGELIGHRTRNLRPLSSCIAPYRPLCASGWPCTTRFRFTGQPLMDDAILAALSRAQRGRPEGVRVSALLEVLYGSEDEACGTNNVPHELAMRLVALERK